MIGALRVNIEFYESLIRSASFYQNSPDKVGETGRKRSHTTGELSSMTEGKSTEETIGRGRSRSLTEPTKGYIAYRTIFSTKRL